MAPLASDATGAAAVAAAHIPRAQRDVRKYSPRAALL